MASRYCCLGLLLLPLPALTAVATQKTALICENGESTPIATLAIESGMDLRRAAGDLLAGCEGGACRVFDQFGFEVADATAVADGQRLFLIPEMRHFVWPAFHVGYRAEWPGMVEAGRPPITLETLSLSPRVFRVSNFMDEGDAEFLIENVLKTTDPGRKLQRSKTGSGNKVSLGKAQNEMWQG